MTGNNLTYRVTGRYMNGSNIVAYHLVGEDGSQIVATKERAIYMIGRGKIENMRIQASGDNIILRGKGINLNTLPIFDVNKSNFRGNQASQAVASNNVAPKKESAVNKMGQLEIKKRIMYKTNCLGYVVSDMSGKELKLSRKRVVELASQRLISNAIAQKYCPAGTNNVTVIIRGVGCDISKLPIVQVDEKGNVVEQVDYMRAVRMKRGGIIYDTTSNTKIVFRPGDYIICGNNAVLRALNFEEATKIIKVVHDRDTAICDKHLDNLKNYPIEMFGSSAQCVNPEQVKRWPIIKIEKTA